MTNKEIIDLVAVKIKQKKVRTRKLFIILIDTITALLDRDETVILSQLGKFSTKKTKGRIGRNPKTGEEIFIPPRIKVIFKPNKKLRQNI